MTVVSHLSGHPQKKDITSTEVGLWVADAYFSVKDDIFEVMERIGSERKVLEENAWRAEQYPMAHFAHETLLEHLEARLQVLLDDAVRSDRTLH